MNTPINPTQQLATHSGGCHCGAVSFEVTPPRNIVASRCNCSICHMTGFIHLIVEQSDFKLIKGDSALTRYEFNTKTAKHIFCKTCGIKSFYIPRSHPHGYSININCLDKRNIDSISITDFNGLQWENSIVSLLDATP